MLNCYLTLETNGQAEIGVAAIRGKNSRRCDNLYLIAKKLELVRDS